MNLIDEIEGLRALEQKATGAPWELLGQRDIQIVAKANNRFWINFDNSDMNDPQFIAASRNLAPAMLEVLGCFRGGDADQLLFVMSGEFRHGGCDCEQCQGAIEVLRRVQKAAAMMEQEARVG